MEQESRIKPCPFCGSPAEIVEEEVELTCKTSVTYYDIWCTNKECYLSEGAGWSFNTQEEAINKWNERKNENDNDTSIKP
jgi:hypothetical protein